MVAPLLAPLVTMLAQQGLTLLGNAVLAKGQDVIESKLGVSLNNTPPEVLKKLEQEHEQMLLDFALEQQKLELETNKLFLADTTSARTLGIELSKADGFLNQNVMPLLAFTTIFGGTSILLTNESADVRMAVVSMMTMVLGYFFGSSKGSKDKQELLHKMGDKS